MKKGAFIKVSVCTILIIAMLAGCSGVSVDSASTAQADSDETSGLEVSPPQTELVNTAFIDAFANPDQKYDAGVRWELPLGNTTEEEIVRELQAFADSGISVVEVTAKGQPTGEIPEGADNAGEDYAAVYGMGTDAWSKTIQTILQNANELGIRVDFHVSVNNGSNKHVPGLSPNDEAASKELVHVNVSVNNGALPSVEAISPEEVTFIDNVDGSEQVLEQNMYAVLLVNVVEKGKTVETYYQLDGTIQTRGGYGIETFEASYDIIDFDKTVDITALYDESATDESIAEANTAVEDADLSDGTWEVISFWWRGDCTTISAVTQYPSYRINYFSKNGTDVLMDYYVENIFRIGQDGYEDMADLLAENGGCIFADSYGANANWANELPAAFLEATGEEITKYLPAMFYANGNIPEGAHYRGDPSKVRNSGYGFSDGSETNFLDDYHDTMTQLLIDNQLIPISEACAELGLQYRDQVVYATSRLDMIEAAAYVDIADCESLNMVDSIDYYNAMTAASRILDLDITSSEHSATYGDTVGCYALPILMALNQANRAFAGGVNQLILHYYTYGSLDYPDYDIAKWPGFSAMGSFFSDSWRDNSPKWEHINIMTDYMARVGYIMREGTVKRDVAVYKQSYWWPRHQSTIWGDDALGNAGYTYDFVSSGLLELDQAIVTDGVLASDTAAYKAFIYDTTENVDFQDVDRTLITIEAIEKLVEYVDAGLPIVMVGSYPAGLQGIATEEEQQRFDTAIAALKENDNVLVVADQSEAADALKSLGVVAAAENISPEYITSYRTQTEDGINYYYLYNDSNNYVDGISSNFYNSVDNRLGQRRDGETASAKIALTGEGIPYLMDAYSGEVMQIAEYEIDKNGRIVVDVTLEVNDATIIAIVPGNTGMLSGTVENAQLLYGDDSLIMRTTESGSYDVTLNDGAVQQVDVVVPEAITIDEWELEILSYTKANDIAAVGQAATEMKLETISGINLSELKAWNELGTKALLVTDEHNNTSVRAIDLADISGIGTYTTTITLAEDWDSSNGGYLDAGDPYDTIVVYVNGTELSTVNQMNMVVDIGEYLVAGENEIVIETNTTLSNALVHLRSDWYGNARVNAYGLRSEVTLIPYTDTTIQ